MPQALGLLDDLTVRENVALPVRLRLGPRRAAEGRTEELLGLFGLAKLADRPPSETSLGQQQRAAVARALVLTPQLVLADEPSAHQDAAWVHDVFAALRQVVHAAAPHAGRKPRPRRPRFADGPAPGRRRAQGAAP